MIEMLQIHPCWKILLSLAVCLSAIVAQADDGSAFQKGETLEQRVARLEAALETAERSLSFNAIQQISAQQPADDGDRLRAVERGLNELNKDWAELRESDVESDVLTKPTFKIGGRIHLDQWYFSDHSPGIAFFENPTTGDDPEDRIFFRRIRLEAGGDIPGNMHYRFQVDFNNPQTPEYKDMYIGFSKIPFFNTVRFGNQKRPLGLDHLNSSRFNIFMERPLMVETFNPDARRIGVASYNSIAEDDAANFTYGVFSLENTRSDGRLIGDSLQMSFNTRLHMSPWYECDGEDYLHLGVSTMFAKPDGDVTAVETNNNDGRFATRSEIRSDRSWLDTGRIAGADWYEVLGLELIYNSGPFQITGEYAFTWMQRDNDTAGTGPDLFFNGAYIFAAYMLTGEHVPYSRKSGTIGRVKPFRNFAPFTADDPNCEETGWGAWQVAARYSFLDLTDNDIRGGVGNDFTLGLVWYFNPYSSLQFNAVYGDIRDHSPTGGFTDGHFTALGTRLRVDF
jgi:phosphate-selective porin OprO and OprP